MKVKICGIMEPRQGKWAAEAGADYLGFIFAPSRRRISVDRAREISNLLHREALLEKVLLVGVFVNESPQVVNQIAETAGLDYVQLSGDESWDYCRLIERPVIKAVKLDSTVSAQAAATHLADEWAGLGTNKLAVLVEPLVPGSYGGTGKQLDWESIEEISRAVPVLLAGGLNAENVEMACRKAKPWGVDVSSGVETDGVKDESKIKAFIAAARRSA